MSIQSSSNTASQKLACLPPGARARITGFALPPSILQRLLEMGLMAGSECAVLRYAPLGDPMEIRVRGYNLSLRKEEAEGVLVSVVS